MPQGPAGWTPVSLGAREHPSAPVEPSWLGPAKTQGDKVSCIVPAGAVGVPLPPGLGMALLPSQEMCLCSGVAFASTPGDTAGLLGGEEGAEGGEASSPQPAPMARAWGYPPQAGTPWAWPPQKALSGLRQHQRRGFRTPLGVPPAGQEDVSGWRWSPWGPKRAGTRAWLVVSKRA